MNKKTRTVTLKRDARTGQFVLVQASKGIHASKGSPSKAPAKRDANSGKYLLVKPLGRGSKDTAANALTGKPAVSKAAAKRSHS